MFAALTDELASSPASVKQWKILRGLKYEYESRMTVVVSKLASSESVTTNKKYVVSSATLTQLNGTYDSVMGGNEYRQVGGLHILAKNDEDRWGFVNSSDNVFLALSNVAQRDPTSVTSWKRLRDGAYSVSVTIKVTLARIANPGNTLTTSPGMSAVPVGEELDEYHVLAPQLPGLTGTYVLDPATKRYELPGGKAWLVQEDSGRWILSNSGGVQAVSFELTTSSTVSSRALWKVSVGKGKGAIVPCRFMQMRRTPALAADELQLVEIITKMKGKLG